MSYKIYRHTDSNCGYPIQDTVTVNASMTTYQVQDLNANSSYHFSVKSVTEQSFQTKSQMSDCVSGETGLYCYVIVSQCYFWQCDTLNLESE